MLQHIDTGRQPTESELEQIQARAVEIFRSPYASPEQMDWAMNVYPEGIAEAIQQKPKPWERANH